MPKVRIAEENKEAEKLIPPSQRDGSGIGINYADAYIKVMNTTLEDGRKIACKRKGLKITMSIGDNKGEALMDKFDNGPDVKNILKEALRTAAKEAASEFNVEDGGIYLEA